MSIPDCSLKRYQELDKLMNDLSAANEGETNEDGDEEKESDLGFKMMVDIWEIIKENPNFDAEAAVRERLQTAASFESSRSCCVEQMVQEDVESMRSFVESNSTRHHIHEHIRCAQQDSRCVHEERRRRRRRRQSASQQRKSNEIPLINTLDNLRKMQSFDNKWSMQLEHLMREESNLMDDVKNLEETEQNDIANLKKVDEMWTAMEEDYKKKLRDCHERQELLRDQIKTVENLLNEMKKSQRDMEKKVNKIDEREAQLAATLEQKNGEVHCIEIESTALRNRIEGLRKSMEITKTKSKGGMEYVGMDEYTRISNEAIKLSNERSAAMSKRKEVEANAKKSIKEARSELAEGRKMVLLLRADGEAMKGEEASIQAEIDGLRQAVSYTDNIYSKKRTGLEAEMQRLEKELKKWQNKCANCHKRVDTAGILNRCSDCPRCWRNITKESCLVPSEEKCICIRAKERLSENILENMYSVLKRDVKLTSGTITNVIFEALYRSRTGMLNGEIRKKIEEYFLKIIVNGLEMSLQGGVAKTICEMDPQDRAELKECLASNTKPLKLPDLFLDDKKKKPQECPFWGGICNCPKGPGGKCPCSKINAKLKPTKAIKKDPNEEIDELFPDKSTFPLKHSQKFGPCACTPETEELCTCPQNEENKEDALMIAAKRDFIDNLLRCCQETVVIQPTKDVILKKNDDEKNLQFEPCDCVEDEEMPLKCINYSEKLPTCTSCETICHKSLCSAPLSVPASEKISKTKSCCLPARVSIATSYSGNHVCPMRNMISVSCQRTPDTSKSCCLISAKKTESSVGSAAAKRAYMDAQLAGRYCHCDDNTCVTICGPSSANKEQCKSKHVPAPQPAPDFYPNTCKCMKKYLKTSQKPLGKKYRPCKEHPQDHRARPNSAASRSQDPNVKKSQQLMYAFLNRYHYN